MVSKKIYKKKITLVLLFTFSVLFACQKNYLELFKIQETIDLSGYPQPIGKLMITKCAVTGCHDNFSYEGAAGLNLTTWQQMLKGGRGGSVTIPGNHNFSTLFIYCNTFADLGIQNNPVMPLDNDSLPRDEVISIIDWINQGALNSKGEKPWPDLSSRRKFYVVNQGCDVVSVFDAETKLIIKKIQVGQSPNNIESAHQIRVSPDNKYWYVVFLNSNFIEKYDAVTDQFLGKVFIGIGGSWNTITFANNGNNLLATDLNCGRVVVINTQDMTLVRTIGSCSGTQVFQSPHGIAVSNDNKYCMVFSQLSNFFYQFKISELTSTNINSFTTDFLAPQIPSNAEPHEIIYSPDNTKLFITCQGTNDVAVIDPITFEFKKLINVDEYPQEMAISKNKNYLLVTCMEQTYTGIDSIYRGSIKVIDINTLQVVKTIKSNSVQPHGIFVDEVNNTAYIANRNVALKGITPHHTSNCGGRNGNLSILDLNTLTLNKSRPELSVDPYFGSIKY